LKKELKKEKDPINLLYMVKKIYPMCFGIKPPWHLVLTRLCAMLLHIFIAANVMVTQIFFDAVYRVSTGQGEFFDLVFAFALLVFFRLANDFVNALNYFGGEVQIVKMHGHINGEIHKKASLIAPVEYENPKRLDDIGKAMGGAGPAVTFFQFTTGFVLRYVTFFVFMGFYLTALKPALVLCLLFVFVPVLVSQILRSSVFSKLEDKAAPIRREFDAYSDAASGKGFYKETRSLGSFGYLKNLLENTIGSLNKAIWGANKKSALADFGFNTLSLFGYGGILVLLVKYLFDGEISVGAFAAVYYSIGMLFGLMEEAICSRIGTIANQYGPVRNFLRFLNMPQDTGADVEIDKKGGIAFENASFGYPNAASDSLKNINLTIEPGETVAIVGENGAGKTTLARLLTGLYKPTKGTVKIGGTDVSAASCRSLFENVSGVFQKYQRYALTLGENVRISDLGSAGDGDPDIPKVEKTLAENHIDAGDRAIFPNGPNTVLSREFDGVDLSGGQWQRIAIARGFYRKSDIMVLDEPTAAIDPLEESAIYKKFVEIAKGKTAVIVTHRLGSAKIADRIVVMKNGEIAEVGTHEKLMEKGGPYADMYAAQAKWYR